MDCNDYTSLSNTQPTVGKAAPAVATTASKTHLFDAILPGLLSTPKFTPHWYNYDKKGSELFHLSAHNNPHYHIYHVETDLLRKYSSEIVSLYGKDAIISDLGAGDSSKTTILIEELLRKNGTCRFYPVDATKEVLEESAERLMNEHDGLSVHPVAGDFEYGLKYLQDIPGTKLITNFGNTFSTIAMKDMLPFLQTVRDTLTGSMIEITESFISTLVGPNDRFVVGVDITQDGEAVKRAYCHETWANFNWNVLTRLNSDFQANFEREKFDYFFKYIVLDGEMCKIKRPQFVNVGFRSKCDQTVNLGAVDKTIQILKDEIIYLHNPGSMTVKWSWQQLEDFIENAGLAIDRKWVDEGSCYGLASLKRVGHDC